MTVPLPLASSLSLHRSQGNRKGRKSVTSRPRPAGATAGVGVALAARGATASSEAADVVLTVDPIDALGDAI